MEKLIIGFYNDYDDEFFIPFEYESKEKFLSDLNLSIEIHTKAYQESKLNRFERVRSIYPFKNGFFNVDGWSNKYNVYTIDEWFSIHKNNPVLSFEPNK